MEFLHKGLVLRSDKQNSAQGSVFYVKKEDERENIEYVLKVYPERDRKSYMVEKTVLEKLESIENLQGFPHLVSVMESDKNNEILLQALGPNLRSLQKQCPNRRFSRATIFKMVIQVIDRLRELHKAGYVHNDLKLENILIGHKDADKLYLIDFGLAQSYIDEEGKHLEKQYVRKFSGNFLFASLNSCRGNNKSRRDDMESVMYIMIYLLNDNYLPWCDIESRFVQQGMEFKDVLRERLEIEFTKRLFTMIPKELIQTLKNVLTLKFDQEPDYDTVIQSIQKALQNYLTAKKIQHHKFEWNQNLATRVQRQMTKEEQKFEQSEFSLDKNQIQRLKSRGQQLQHSGSIGLPAFAFGHQNKHGSINLPSQQVDIRKTSSKAFNLMIGDFQEQSHASIIDHCSPQRGHMTHLNFRSKSTFANRKVNTQMMQKSSDQQKVGEPSEPYQIQLIVADKKDETFALLKDEQPRSKTPFKPTPSRFGTLGGAGAASHAPSRGQGLRGDPRASNAQNQQQYNSRFGGQSGQRQGRACSQNQLLNQRSLRPSSQFAKKHYDNLMKRLNSRGTSRKSRGPGEEGKSEEDDEDKSSMSEYRDENAEPDEVDENGGNPIKIKVKKLQTHEMNIKKIDKVQRYNTHAFDIESSDDEDADQSKQPKKILPRKQYTTAAPQTGYPDIYE